MEPKILVNLDQRTIEIKYPQNFFIHFMGHENTGERIVLHSMAVGLVCLHNDDTKNIDERIIEVLQNFELFDFEGVLANTN